MYQGLVFDGASPTDIDGFLELDDRLFVFFEAKHVAGAMKSGQRVALERLCNACRSEKRHAEPLRGRFQA